MREWTADSTKAQWLFVLQPTFLSSVFFCETNLFTVAQFWLTQSVIIIVYWFELYLNQSWNGHILFNLLKQHWIKHNATSFSVADWEAAPLYINEECMKVDEGTVANLTLAAHLLTHIVLSTIVTDWQGNTEIRLCGLPYITEQGKRGTRKLHHDYILCIYVIVTY